MAQAAKGLGVSLEFLKAAKREGAPGFRGSRVYTVELLPWIKAKQELGEEIGDSKLTELEMRKLRVQVERLEFDFDVEKKKYWPAAPAREAWFRHMAQGANILRELPILAPQLCGKSVADIEKKLQAVADDFLSKLRGNPYGDGNAGES